MTLVVARCCRSPLHAHRGGGAVPSSTRGFCWSASWCSSAPPPFACCLSSSRRQVCPSCEIVVGRSIGTVHVGMRSSRVDEGRGRFSKKKKEDDLPVSFSKYLLIKKETFSGDHYQMSRRRERSGSSDPAPSPRGTRSSSKEAKPQLRIKVTSLGSAGTGKSCLIKRFCESRFVQKCVCSRPSLLLLLLLPPAAAEAGCM